VDEKTASPILDTFKEVKYALLAALVLLAYCITLLFFDSFLFFAPYFTLYVPASEISNLILDLLLSALTTVVLTVSVRQILLQRGSGETSKAGALGIIAALVAGACPCYYLIPLLAFAGTIGGVLGAVGILFNAFQTPIKLIAVLILAFSTYKLQKSGVCKVATPNQRVQRRQGLNE
jgi:hypothetical protein